MRLGQQMQWLNKLKFTKTAIIWTLATTFFACPSAFAAGKKPLTALDLCSQLARSLVQPKHPIKYGRKNPDSRVNKNDFIRIKTVTPVLNQWQEETCHLNAWASLLESAYYRRTGEKIDLSSGYL